MKSHIRFDKNLTKVSDPVEYPCVLQLQNKVRTLVPHILSPFEITHHYLQKMYFLKSILCLQGLSINHGHYVSCVCIGSQWYHINDEKVCMICYKIQGITYFLLFVIHLRL